MWQWHVRAESYSSWNTSKASRMTLRRSLKSSGRRRQEVRQRRSGGMSTNERAPLRTRKTKLPKRPFLVLIFRRLQRFCKLKVVRQLQKSNELSKREFWYSILTKWRNISRLLTRNISRRLLQRRICCWHIWSMKNCNWSAVWEVWSVSVRSLGFDSESEAVIVGGNSSHQLTSTKDHQLSMMFEWELFFGCHIQPAHQQYLSPEAHISEMFKLAHVLPVVVETCESFVVALFSNTWFNLSCSWFVAGRLRQFLLHSCKFFAHESQTMFLWITLFCWEAFNWCKSSLSSSLE